MAGLIEVLEELEQMWPEFAWRMDVHTSHTTFTLSLPGGARTLTEAEAREALERRMLAIPGTPLAVVERPAARKPTTWEWVKGTFLGLGLALHILWVGRSPKLNLDASVPNRRTRPGA